MAEQTEAQRTEVLRTPYSGIIDGLNNVSRGAVRFARRHPLGGVAGVILIVVGVIAIAAPIVAPDDPLFVDWTAFTQDPSRAHLVGTDYAGRDILSRVIFGSRVSLEVSLLAVLFGTSSGAVWGLASAYVGGRFDMVSQRILEIIMSFPALILAMILVAGMGAGFWVVVTAIAVTRTPYSVRVIRSVALSVKEYDYVLAARAIGASNVRIMAFHVGPQCIASFLILATAHLGVAIIIEASLGFIGAGIPPPTPTWGNMLGATVADVLIPHWPLVVFPGVAITVTVLAFNLFGDAIRDALDPKLRGR